MRKLEYITAIIAGVICVIALGSGALDIYIQWWYNGVDIILAIAKHSINALVAVITLIVGALAATGKLRPKSKRRKRKRK